jgi:carbon-monoxide dehydrogenase catalytic subunit
MVKELIKNDVLVVVTGCSAIANAKAGLLKPEAAFEFAGRGLQEICEAVGIPPVLHVGSCVDNSRILVACCELVREGGIGESISELPVAGAAPEWMSEKAITIGFYFVASGVFTVFGWPQPVFGSENVTNFITKELEGIVGGKFAFESDPIKAAHLMIEHINKKREQLKLKPMMYEPQLIK